MKKAIFFIDGFNLYHALANSKYQKYKWLNFSKFATTLSINLRRSKRFTISQPSLHGIRIRLKGIRYLLEHKNP
jgi:hypothetical protein